MVALFPSREVLLSIGPLSVHWYGVMYALAFLLGLALMRPLFALRGLEFSRTQIDRLFLWIVLGVVIGGRLGFVFFYGGSAYFSDPLKILRVWEGGMSSHGGFAGVSLALLLFSVKERAPLLRLVDALTVPIAIGLLLGRVGNFINGELYGTVSTLPWAMSFPHAEGLRHPTQIYAALKDAFIAALTFMHLSWTRNSFVSGRTTAIFLLLYGLLRYLVEMFREQTYPGFEVGFIALSRGQVLTLPIIVVGCAVLLWTLRTRTKSL